MLIAVGSLNPAKLEAVKLGFEAYLPGQTFSLIGTAARSGVSEQPVGKKEMLIGARNRAAEALRLVPEAMYAVGLEGGTEHLDGSIVATACMVVVDRDRHEGFGFTVGMPLPSPVERAFRETGDLGTATDIAYQETNTKHGTGFFGCFTGNRISRPAAYRDALIVALSHLEHQRSTLDTRNESSTSVR